MSVQIIERRYCDMCETEYSDRPDWMILSAPNAPEDVDAQWDFCSYACLTQWITSDEVDDAGPDFGVEYDTSRAAGLTGEQAMAEQAALDVPVAPVPRETKVRTPEELAEAQARMDKAMAVMDDKPPMSLMEALTSGALKFDRSAD